MIYFFVTAEHAYTMRAFVESWPDRLRIPIEIVPYNELIRKHELKRGIYIFADIERLSKGQARALRPIWNQLKKAMPAGALLNHPSRSMGRFELLKYAHDRGMNDYNVHLISTDPSAVRFPAFVRQASEHNGNLTPLLNSPAEVERALEKLPKKRSFRRDLMITEFCDVSDEQETYRKYAVFRVGDSIVPRHLFFSQKWMQKYADNTEYDTAMLAEERAFLENNPHEEQLREFFDAAGIKYGRIDYGIKDGRIQAWEINTNPMLIWAERMQEYGVRRTHNELFLANILEAFHKIGETFAGEEPVTLRPTVLNTACYDLAKARKLGLKYAKKKVKNHSKAFVKKMLGIH